MNRRAHRLAERTARRLQWKRTISHVRGPLLVLGVVMLLLAIWDRWPGGPRVDWLLVGCIEAVAAAMWMVWSLLQSRATLLDGAIVLDEALDTGEALSTSLLIPPDDDDVVSAEVHAAADRRAESIDLRRGPAAAVDVAAPEGWWWGLLLLVPAVALLFFEPLPGRGSLVVEDLDLTMARAEAEETAAMLQAQLEQSPELVEDMSLDMDWQLAQRSDDPAEIRRESLRQMTELSRRLNAFQDSAAARRTEAVRQRLKRAAPGEGEGFAGEIRRAMASGDMEAMAEAIGQARQVGTQEDVEGLASLASDVRDSAKDNTELTDALSGSGLDPALSDLPEVLAEAIDEAEHLSMQQKEDLQQLSDTQQQAEQTMEEHADELDSVAGQCSGSQGESEASSKASTSSQSSQKQDAASCPSEQLARKQIAQRQAAQCQRVCQGGSDPGAPVAGPQARGPGPGGKQAASQEDPNVDFEQIRVRQGVDEQASVVQSTEARGVIVRGDATATPGQAVQQARRRLAEGIDVKSVPRRYREAVAAWFTAIAPEGQPLQEPDDGTDTSAEKVSSP